MDEKKRIAFLCHPYHRGGVTRWMADAAISFANSGHEVYFMTLEPVQPFFSGIGRETMLALLAKEKNDIHIVKLNVGRLFEFGTPEYRAFIYKRLFLNLPLGTPVILSDDSTVWEAAVSLHTSFPIVGVLHADEEYYYQLGVKYFDRLSALTCVSNRIFKKITERLHTTYLPHIYTISCGINLPPVNASVSSGDLLQLIYVGRITNYQKRVGDLVKIVALLLKNKVHFHLRIVGDGGDEKTVLQQKFKEENLDSYVTFCGWLSGTEVTNYLRSSDLLVLTSDFEGTPVAMMEALASGCGIVGTRVSGIEDYENEPLAKKCFAVYEVGNIETAVTKIINLSTIPVLSRRKSAREIAETNFSMHVCCDKYLKIMDGIPLHIYITPTFSLSFVENIHSRLISLVRFLKVKYSKISL